MPDLHVIRLIVNRKVRWIAARLALLALVLRALLLVRVVEVAYKGKGDLVKTDALSAAAGAESSVTQITRELVRTGLRKNPSLPMLRGRNLAKNPSLAQIFQTLNAREQVYPSR